MVHFKDLDGWGKLDRIIETSKAMEDLANTQTSIPGSEVAKVFRLLQRDLKTAREEIKDA